MSTSEFNRWQRGNIARRSDTGSAPLTPGTRVVVWTYTQRGGHIQQWPARIVAGPRKFKRANFLRYLVRPRYGGCRWVSVISIVSSVAAPVGRLPA